MGAFAKEDGAGRVPRQRGPITRERIPAALRAHTFGPRVSDALGYLSGSQHRTQRGLEETAEALFEVPVSPCRLNTYAGELSQALEPPHQDIAQVVQQAEVKHVEETGWKQVGQKR